MQQASLRARTLAVASALVAISAVATPQDLVVTDATAPLPVAEDFSGMPSGEVDGILDGNGVSFAEDCIGQTTTELPTYFELTTGDPLSPPTLAVPLERNGVWVANSFILYGLAQGITSEDIAEGAIAIRYHIPQPLIGLRIDGGQPPGSVTFRAFDATGGLVGTATVDAYPERDVTIHSTGAPFVLINFNNDDPGGCGVRAMRHQVESGQSFCSGDDSGTPCPCGNAGQAGHGCANGTFTAGARLAAPNPDSLSVWNATPNQPVLFFEGVDAVAGGNGIPFGDGLRCVSGSVLRLLVKTTDSTGYAVLPSILVQGGGGAPGLRYQAWYRDPLLSPCGSQFNLTNGIELP